jgi:hypothetical protein
MIPSSSHLLRSFGAVACFSASADSRARFTPNRMHFAAHFAKCMDSDTHRRQLIYELLREVD